MLAHTLVGVSISSACSTTYSYVPQCIDIHIINEML